MIYVIKNITKKNIVIGKKPLAPGKTIEVYDDLKPYQNLLKVKYIEIKKLGEENLSNIEILTANNEIIENKADSINIENNDIVLDNNFVKENLKQRLIESFFNYYLVKELSQQDLNLLKWFYKNVGFTSGVNSDILNLLDNIKNEEELTEVLLNHIYPELLENYLTKEKNK